MIVYKYRRDADTTERIFTSGKVWLATPAALNDPFEASLQPVAEEFSAEKVATMKQAQLAGFLVEARRHRKTGGFFGLDKRQVDALLARFKNFREVEPAYASFREFITRKTGNPPSDPSQTFSRLPQELAAVGIFSLSEVADNSLMWAHYAGDHKGLTLGFEVTDGSPLADASRCLHVQYSDDDVPALGPGFQSELSMTFGEKGLLRSSTRIPLSDPTLRAAISTKGLEWAYEREWRYVEPDAGEFEWPGPIVEITFGLQCPQARRDHYAKLAAECIPNDIRLYEMRKVPNTRSLERVRIEVSPSRLAIASPAASLAEVERLLESRNFVAALPLIDRLLATGAESAELWRCRGLALGWSDDHAGALDCFERAVTLDPTHFSSWYQKGVALMQLRRLDEALVAYEAALKLDTRDPSVAYNIGNILAHLERYDEALIRLVQAERQGHPRAAERVQSVEALRQAAR